MSHVIINVELKKKKLKDILKLSQFWLCYQFLYFKVKKLIIESISKLYVEYLFEMVENV